MFRKALNESFRHWIFINHTVADKDLAHKLSVNSVFYENKYFEHYDSNVIYVFIYNIISQNST